jgi:predicted molibdopterin-dependent oxidoreductase YjgC
MVLQSDGEETQPPGRGCVLSTCPYCSCGCGLHFLTDSSRPVGVSPSRSHPVSRGRLCARGWGAHEADLWGDRLLGPRVRDSSGQRPTSWPEALSRAAGELKALLAAGKSVGVLVSGRCTNEEAYLGVKLARGALRTGNVDGPLRLHYEALLQGLADAGESTHLVGSLAWVEESDQIFVLEGDVASTHPEVAFSVLRGLRRGASLITLGLARTQISQVASSHIFLDLGSPRFLHSGPLEISGESHSGSGRASVILSPWTQDPDALAASVATLAEYVGPIVRESGHTVRFLPLPIRANTRGAFEMGAAPGWLPGGEPLGAEAARDRLSSLWGAEPACEAGLDVEGMRGTVEGLVVVRDGLSAGGCIFLPESQTSPSLESLVVVDALRSPASDAATVVLPIGGLSETEGTFTSGVGRVQAVRAAGSPPGVSRQGWAVLSDLLDHLGLSGRYSSVADVFSEIRAVVPSYAAVTGEALEQEWGSTVPAAGGAGYDGLRGEGGAVPAPQRRGLNPERSPQEQEAGTIGEEDFGTHWLAVEGAFEWSEDPMVLASPTLRRDGAARRKLHPRGFVVMSPADGASLGVREGWTLRLRSSHGEALVPVSLSSRVEEGFLLVPAGLREPLMEVLGDAAVGRVEVERA